MKSKRRTKRNIRTRNNRIRKNRTRNNRTRNNRTRTNMRGGSGLAERVVDISSSVLDKLVQILPGQASEYVTKLRNLVEIVHAINKSSGIEVLKKGKTEAKYDQYKKFYNILLIITNRLLNDIDVYLIIADFAGKGKELLNTIKAFLVDLRKRLIKMGTDEELYGDQFEDKVNSAGMVVDRVINKEDIMFFSQFETTELLVFCLSFIQHNTFTQETEPTEKEALMNEAKQKLGLSDPTIRAQAAYEMNPRGAFSFPSPSPETPAAAKVEEPPQVATQVSISSPEGGIEGSGAVAPAPQAVSQTLSELDQLRTSNPVSHPSTPRPLETASSQGEGSLVRTNVRAAAA